MAELKGFPNIDQKRQGINRWEDCVPTIIVDMLDYLTQRKFDVESVKAAVYGKDYVGPTDPRRYVSYLRRMGCSFYPIEGAGATLVEQIHKQIQMGRPVLGTEHNPYGGSRAVDAVTYHVLGFWKEQSADKWEGKLTADDPWGAQTVTHSDKEWANILQFHEIWVMELLIRRGASPTPVPTSTTLVPAPVTAPSEPDRETEREQGGVIAPTTPVPPIHVTVTPIPASTPQVPPVSTVSLSPEEAAAQRTGRVIMFIGNECMTWGLSEVARGAASRLRLKQGVLNDHSRTARPPDRGHACAALCHLA